MPTWPDPKFSKLTPDVLAALSADEVGAAIVQHVELRLMAPGIDRDAIVSLLPPGTGAIYTTWLVDTEVNAGGFNQFFFNPYGKLAGHALVGYELLGTEEYAAIMRAAIATHEAERDRMQPYYTAQTPEAFSDSYRVTQLGEIDQRYYALGDRIYDVWALFVRRRPDLFAS
ncbi:MAG TPA: DUF4375 domain-containing protein [Gemmatimonadaceae bacterium]|jgi:hypothetical protein|nr:DUF4375 domain-containing protein [Gemmatimonadaceae bacterium]